MIKLPFSNSLYFNNNRNHHNSYPQNDDVSNEQAININNVPLLNEPKNQKDTRSSDKPFSLDILGFSLQLDDLIILGLLYFLYTEGVEDLFLYIALLLLLLS